MKKSLLATLLLIPLVSFSAVYQKPTNGDVIGETKIVYAEGTDSLIDIGERYEAGFDELQWANPEVSTWTPGEDTPIILPFKYILPNGKRSGIVSNIPEMRTYYFPKDEDLIYVYPVSVGRMDWKTPLGTWKITVKQEDPPWYPPESIRREHREMGRGELPRVVPAGPDNPMGRHVLRLNLPSYLLHGTNDTTGIGMRVTHGCMRFFPDNIEELYNIVPNGTEVTFLNEPIKWGWEGDDLLIEVHPPLEEDNMSTEELLIKAYELLAPFIDDPNIEVSRELVDVAIRQMSGLPVIVGTRNPYKQLTIDAEESALGIDWNAY